MKFYLSSYKIGNEAEKLQELTSDNKKTAYISNAMDAGSRVEAIRDREIGDIADLVNLGLEVEQIDLRTYFGKSKELEKKLSTFGLLWICGGNVFVLRQAMKLSGLDNLLHKLENQNIVYGGYSAGACVLAPSLKGLHIVDDANAKPYGNQFETIWEGLNMIPYAIAPHFDSDHPESEDIDKEIQYCIDNHIPYKPLRDGEVIIIE